MGTRNAQGFRVNGQDKVTYCQFDGYPSGKGVIMVELAQKIASDLPKYRAAVEAIQLVTDEVKPTAEQITKLKELGLYDGTVSTGSEEEWYCLLREAQENPSAYLDAGLMEDRQSFLKDSLFCEYAYIINFDDETIEFYKGFNHDQNAAGRYAKTEEGDEYAGVALVGSVKLSEVTVEKMNELFVQAGEEI